MTDHRKVMDLSTLETLIMLQMNREFWDEQDMEWILCNPRFFDNDDGDQAVGVRRPRDEDNDDDDVHSMMTTSSTHGDQRRQRTTSSSSGWHPLGCTSSIRCIWYMVMVAGTLLVISASHSNMVYSS